MNGPIERPELVQALDGGLSGFAQKPPFRCRSIDGFRAMQQPTNFRIGLCKAQEVAELLASGRDDADGFSV
jgi:hypothetical protein